VFPRSTGYGGEREAGRPKLAMRRQAQRDPRRPRGESPLGTERTRIACLSRPGVARFSQVHVAVNRLQKPRRISFGYRRMRKRVLYRYRIV